MRPDGRFVAAFRLVVTGIIHQRHVDIAVPVRIISAEIHLGIQAAAGFRQGAGDVIDIGRAVLGKDIRAKNFKNGRILSVGVLDIEVADRARSSVGGIALLVEQGVEGRTRVFQGERRILERDEDDGNPVGSLRQARRPGGLEGVRPRPLGILTHFQGLGDRGGGRLVGGTEESVRTAGDDPAAFVREIVEPLVTMDPDGDRASVRLGQPDFPGIGRNGGKDMEGAQKERKGSKDSLHGYWMHKMIPVPLPAMSHAFPSAIRTTWTDRSEKWVAACLT